jgi:outer membrane protein insertion porin family
MSLCENFHLRQHATVLRQAQTEPACPCWVVLGRLGPRKSMFQNGFAISFALRLGRALARLGRRSPSRVAALSLLFVLAAQSHCFAGDSPARSRAASLAAQEQAAIEGIRVAQIRVVDETGQSIRMPLLKLSLEPGQPFNFESERSALRELYRQGDYSNITVTATDEFDGLHIDFVVDRNYYYNVISIEGLKAPPTESVALASMHLALGEPYRDSSIRDGVQRLHDALRADGFYSPKINWTLEKRSDTRQMDVVFTVDPGLRARIGDISVNNNTPYTSTQLLKRSKVKSRQDFTSSRLEHASERLKNYLVGKGYLGASVVISPGAYDSRTNRVPLMYAVTAGPRVRIAVVGARLHRRQLKTLLPIFAEGAVDEDLLQEGRRNIRDYFQRQGYFSAEVSYRTENAANNTRVIVYKVSRGDRFRLVGVAFTGNKYFSDSLLAGRLQIQTASFAFNGRFSQNLLRADADSIRDLYVSNGFRGAKVDPHVDDRYRRKKGNLFVTFHITEGVQTRVASLQIEGNHAIPTATLMSVIGSTAGQPYSAQDVASDRNNILALYFNQGFSNASFHEDVLPVRSPSDSVSRASAGESKRAADPESSDTAPASDRVRLIYHITEGQQIEVRNVLLTGYQYTKPSVIQKQVQIRPGGPLREHDVAETQRRLYNLGVFTRVQIAPQNPDGADPNKVMVVDATEGQRYTIGYGFGFEAQEIGKSCGSTTVSNNNIITTCDPNATQLEASPRGIFEISRADMFGRAQTLTLQLRGSTLEYRSALSYTAGNFLSNNSLSLELTGFAEKTQDITTFTSTRYEGALQMAETLTPSSSLLYRYFYRRVEASNLNDTINPEEIPLLSQPTLVSGVGITYARDRRDNPADPSRGTFNTADVSVASTKLGSGASFFRGFFQNSSYTPFGRAFVFARSLRFGIEEPLANTVEGNTPFNIGQCTGTQPVVNEQLIPLPERFFAGGGTSLRGFELNQAGPRDPCSGFPIGGLALLAFNQELRFPMRLPFIGNRLGGTLFYDGGNVYSDFNHINFNWKPDSTTELNYFSHTVGFGLRYGTPVGPVRVDFGYQLNPALYQFYNSTVQQLQYLRLPHFSFSFNIGPVF